MSTEENTTKYGNLYSYKFYLRPTVHRLYGDRFSSIKKIKHHENVQKLLHVLFLHGTCTTWEMAKIKHPNDVSTIRTKEKEYRRLIKGRTDRGKHSSGIMELGLVINDGQKFNKGYSDTYRLSLPGILYCLDVLNLSKKEIDQMAAKYAIFMPKLFGKWEFLKSLVDDDVYKIQILARGLLLDNPELSLEKSPLYELMSYLNFKYRKFYEFISEKDLSEQISYWFYTCILYQNQRKGKNTLSGVEKLHAIFKKDKEIATWYKEFFKESELYFKDRTKILKNSGIF
ncbi:hypothetical protein [Nitrosopumilus maritimus]|uniref:Uncharacterized protein n=1 Tax=Nitrosopumilus maritimus (strain SCM1) TaxID=436308 RepID=A9A1G6_NITMS|nr:hypothetical protein [Nitrosopumilus maritimus]ABX13145.1 hypothetical protein Nmar_1249 [Nitrosopumilus maritimus SCM1]